MTFRIPSLKLQPLSSRSEAEGPNPKLQTQMFDFLKTKNDDQPLDVKGIRHKLSNFIKEQLQRWEGGEGSYIKGMQFFLAPQPEEKHVFETAVFYNEEGRFKEEEVQKIADDFDIDLPASWNMDIIFTEQLPAEAIKSKELPVALHIATNKQPTINKPSDAKVTILNGEAEQQHYNINWCREKFDSSDDTTHTFAFVY